MIHVATEIRAGLVPEMIVSHQDHAASKLRGLKPLLSRYVEVPSNHSGSGSKGYLR